MEHKDLDVCISIRPVSAMPRKYGGEFTLCFNGTTRRRHGGYGCLEPRSGLTFDVCRHRYGVDLGPGVRQEFFFLSFIVFEDLHLHVDQLARVDGYYSALYGCRGMSFHCHFLESSSYPANGFELPRRSAIVAYFPSGWAPRFGVATSTASCAWLLGRGLILSSSEVLLLFVLRLPSRLEVCWFFSVQVGRLHGGRFSRAEAGDGRV